MSKQTAPGEIVEQRFKDWLDRHKIPHWYIQQDIDSFSPALRRYFTKRPDFMVLIPNMGFFLIDATYKAPAEKYDQFFMDPDEAVSTLSYRECLTSMSGMPSPMTSYTIRPGTGSPSQKFLKLVRERLAGMEDNIMQFLLKSSFRYLPMTQ